MPRWPIFQGAEHFVSAFLIEGPRLKAVRLQRRGKAATFDGISFCRPEQARAIALAPRGYVHPEKLHMHPAAPDVTNQPTQPFPARTLQEETDRVVRRVARHGQIMSGELVYDQPAQGI